MVEKPKMMSRYSYSYWIQNEVEH